MYALFFTLVFCYDSAKTIETGQDLTEQQSNIQPRVVFLPF